MQMEVQAFCHTCLRCQQTAPQKPTPAPLHFPLIGVPCKRVGMDLVGPLLKSARGHENNLVMVDYATRYPEAVPLRKATSRNVARELLALFSRAGIPKDILTDQGTPFTSQLTVDLCGLLQVKHLRTSVYHPQIDGLVERFNQTIKRMLCRVIDEEGRNWDLPLLYVLFAIRETPQASMGFTPFGLLFRWRPRGHADKDRLGVAQRDQQRIYNRPAQPREFDPGDQVMLLVPNVACKFLAKWADPYTVLKRVGPKNYRL
ncbi:hypothetical protein QTP70_028996, partial [Hemibagrus guttatus]